MQAYRFNAVETGMQLQNVEIPKPSPGEVLIAVNAAGLCHSDCHILKGSNWVGKLPITLGHEVAGTVVALGDGVSTIHVGNRVAVALISHPVTDQMLSTSIGLGFDGGFAEYVIAPITHVVQIPDNVSLEQAAVATDSISSSYHAIVTEGRVGKSTTVAIVGLGGLGLNGLRIALLQGSRVYGIDIDDDKHSAAKALGAVACFSSLDAIKDEAVDVVVDFVGLSATLSSAIAAVKLGGRVVVVGLGGVEITLPLFPLVTRSIELKGSIGASLEDLHAVLALIERGQINPSLEEIPFSDLKQGYERLERGAVSGRLFTRPTSKSA